MPNLSAEERKVLRALASAFVEYEEFSFLSFAGISRRCRLNRKIVRRCSRSLARKGFAQYGRGLWNDAGEVAGSGYACTKAGREVLGEK